MHLPPLSNPPSEPDRSRWSAPELSANRSDVAATPPVPAPSKTRSGRRIVIIVLALTSLAGVYGLGRASRRRQQAELEEAAEEAEMQAPTVNVVKPVRGPRITELCLPGEARAFDETTIFARTSGYVSRWLVDIGDRVQVGQALANIDTPELDAQLVEARAKVTALEAEVRLAQTHYAFARHTSERWESAAPNGAVSEQERDEKNSEVAIAQARLDAARAQVELGKATVKGLEDQAGFKTVVAPFDGVITQRRVDVGSLITAGSTASTTPLFAIAQYDRVRVCVRVPQAAIPDVHIGMEASITAHEYPGRTFSGKVDRTAGSIDASSRTLKVEILAENPDLTLLPGMYVLVHFQISRSDPPYIVQASAVSLRTAGPEIAVVGPDQRVRFRKIQVVRELGDTVEIADQIGDNESLALNISDEIADGDRVRPVQISEGETRSEPVSVPAALAPAVTASPLGVIRSETRIPSNN